VGQIFVFIICLKQIFLVAAKFGETHKILEGRCPRLPPHGYELILG